MRPYAVVALAACLSSKPAMAPKGDKVPRFGSLVSHRKLHPALHRKPAEDDKNSPTKHEHGPTRRQGGKATNTRQMSMLTRRGICTSIPMPNGPMVILGRSIILDKLVAFIVLAEEDLSQSIQTLLSSAIADSQHFKLITASMIGPLEQPY